MYKIEAIVTVRTCEIVIVEMAVLFSTPKNKSCVKSLYYIIHVENNKTSVC